MRLFPIQIIRKGEGKLQYYLPYFDFIIYIQFLMEAQDLYQGDVDKLFQLHNPHPATLSQLAVFLNQECKNNINNTKSFLESLLNHKPILINFHIFCQLVRTIKKVVVPLKNEDCRLLLSDFIITHGKLFFPYVQHANSKQFKDWIDLFVDLQVREPKDLSDSRNVVVFLSKKAYSQNFAAKLVEVINNEVLVQKKSQNIKNFKINEFYSPFIVKHIDQLFPQLERLLVRSESNIEVWDEFVATVKNWEGIDEQLLTIIKRIKHLYLSNPESSIEIVSTLTCSLSQEGSLKEVVSYISSLVSSEHNLKKKIVYIRMFEGVIKSLKGHSDEKLRNIFSQEILVTISNSLIKFAEEEQFNILVKIIDSLVPLISDPKDDIAKALKVYLKNQNKYILIMMGLIMSGVYRKQHVDSLPSVKQIFNNFKTQLPTYLKKIEINWQWMLPILNFLANCDLQYIDHLSENLPLFKVSCLALAEPEKKVGLNLLLNKIKQLKSQEEEIEDLYFIITALLLQEINNEKDWEKFLSDLTPVDKVHIVSRGIFPLTIYECTEQKKNKGNQFSSLLLFLKKKLKSQKIEVDSAWDFVKLAVCYHNHTDFLKNSFSVTKEEELKEIIEKYVKSSLFDIENDEENKLNDREMATIDKMTLSLLQYRQDFLVQLLELLTTEEYYKKDLTFLIDFEGQVEENLKEIKAKHSEWKELLVDRQIYKVEEVKPKKVYLGQNFEVKMMSQNEVKEQKYRNHFLKMIKLFEKVTHLFLGSLNDHALLSKFWHHHLKQILAITHHPEHRLNIFKIVKQSCLFTAQYNKKQQESKIFIRNAQFLGDFFSFRNSKITPSVKIMHHCQNFMKQLLQLPFQNENSSFKMFEDQENQFVMLFANEVCQYLLQNMQFDLNLKKLAILFYHKSFQKMIFFGNDQTLFTFIVKNINILASSEHIQPVLFHLLSNVGKNRYKQLFADILNFVQSTKKLILSTINMLKEPYQPEFEEFIKLKILALESNPDISKIAAQTLTSEVELKSSILNFDMKTFVKKNSKETTEKLCQFIKEEITKDNAEGIFNLVIKASEELFDENFDQEGLEILPYFLEINIEHINEKLFKPIFYLLSTKFTSKEEFGTLNRMSVDIGIDIIKRNAEKYGEQLLLVLESFINKASGVSNIIFLGVLARYLQGNKNLQIIQKRITELFKGNKENDQKSISKCMPDLMSFFKQPLQIVKDIFTNIGTMKEEQQVGQSYLFTGLLKGVGYVAAKEYLQKTISSQYVTKTRQQKSGRILLLHAFVENFGRVVQVRAIKIIEIILGYMADSIEEIRNLSRRTGQNLILKMSSYSVKILLPQLLKGLEVEQNWRVKISYIWILGVMANCSAKQLQTSLPIIVPSLSTCLSDAHPTIREKASEAMNLIGQTIKNPEISQCVDILIEALENPFENSAKAIEILLKTSFNHYIDPPSLSMIIPILDYCMRGRSSDLKAGACQVMGSIVELISNSSELLPYLKIIITGIRVSLCDPLPEIRRIASMAIGKISTKIGINDSEDYFKFVVEIIESSTSNSIQRQGAAQAHAEIICSQTYEYFEEGLYKIFDKLNNVKHSEKEGYILVFLFVPSIKTQEFEGFIKEVNENMYSFVSDEDQVIRNSAMQVQKVLISNYCLTHTDLLLEPLCDGAFDNNWKKRNSAIILIGQILNIIKSHMYNTRTTDKAYAYYRGLMAVYIMKDDELQMPRMTANQVWNTYIDNTPKTIKTGIQELVKMWTKWTHSAGGVVFKNIIAFSTKYGENYFSEILDFLPNFLKQPEHQVGVFEVLAEFIKRLNLQFLSKESYKSIISSFFSDHLFSISENVRPALAKCLALYVEKMNEERFFEGLLYPVISKMNQTEEATQDYTYNLHLLKDLLNTHSNKVVDRVISKIMEHPMSEFKIEVITNNAQKLANYLYSHFKRPATEVLVEEIYSLVGDKSKENRLSLIIYCLEQVSLQLSRKYKTDFLKMINNNITKRVQIFENSRSAEDKKILQIFVNMVFFFLNSTPLSEIEDLDIIIGQICPLIFLNDEDLGILGHKIYLLVITDSKSYKTAEYIKQMTVSFENKIAGDDQHIWQNEEIFYDYITILVKGIAYGKEEVMEESLQMVEFVIKHTPRVQVDKYILKIVGPIIRISNYPLLLRQKLRILELIISISNQNFKIDPYRNQILSVCLRLLQQFKNNDEVMQTIANMYFSLLKNTVLKQQLIIAILGKFKVIGNNLLQTFYYLINTVIKEGVQLPKNVFEKIYEETTTITLNSPEKVTVKGLYYASKTSARVAVLLGKPIEQIESQLKGITVSYELLLNYLHFTYYKKARIEKMESIEIFLKESNRQKIFNLLKAIKLNTENHEQTRKLYRQDYLKSLIPENMIGFQEISDILEDFESEEKTDEPEGEINET